MLRNKINWGCKFFSCIQTLSEVNYKPVSCFATKKRVDLFDQRKFYARTNNTLKISEQSEFLSVPKQTTKSPINIKQFLADEEITQTDIENFDYLYRSPKISSVTRQGNAKIVQRGRMKINIPSILKLKLGASYEKILFFLRNRGEFITEIELHYCFMKLTELKKFAQFASEEEDVLIRVIEAASRIQFINYACVIDLLAQAVHEDLNDEEYLTQLMKCAYNLLKDTKYQEITLEQVELTIRVLEQSTVDRLIEAQAFLDYLSDRMFSLVDSPVILINLIKRINPLINDFAASRAYVNLELLLQERKSFVTNQDLIEILDIYAKGKVEESILFVDLLERLRKSQIKFEKVNLIEQFQQASQPKAETAIFSEHDAGRLIYAVAQFDKLKQDFELWEFLEAKYLHFLHNLRLQGQVVEKNSFSAVIQAFDIIEHVSKHFWTFPFLKVLTNQQESVQLDFEDLLCIFYNRLRFKVFDIEMFKGLVVYEMQTRMNYLPDYSFEKATRVLFSYLCGIDYSLELLAATDPEGTDKFKTDLDVLSSYMQVQLKYYLKQEFEKKEISVQCFLRFFLCLGYGMHLKIFNFSEELLRPWFIELKYKYDKSKDVLPKAIINSFLWRFNKSIRIKRTVFEEDFINIIKNGLTVEFIPLMEAVYLTNYNDDYIWGIIELRLIKCLEELSIDDFLRAIAIMSFHKSGTNEFWEFCSEHFVKVIRPCISKEQFGLFAKFFNERPGEQKFNELLEQFKDADPGFDLASQIAERPGLFRSSLAKIVEHSYGTNLKSEVNEFYVYMLTADL